MRGLKEKKGFTFVELLAVIIILGIVVAAVLFSVSKLLDDSRKKYYDGQESTLILAGKEYFGDYRSKLPKEIGSTNFVTLTTLVAEKYIDPIYNHNKQVCSGDTTKVYVQKVSEKEFQYYAILDCPSYQTVADTNGPVISFIPNKAITNQAVKVTMKIQDNQQVASYRYDVYKNGIKNTTLSLSNFQVVHQEVTSHQVQLTLPIEKDQENKYYLVGYALDGHGNSSSKKSGMYVIDAKAPDCSSITFTPEGGSDIWYEEDLSLTIDKLPKDTAKWEWYTAFGAGLYSKQKTLTGPSKLVTSFTKEGKNFGKVKVYDQAMNSCEKTAQYNLEKIPVIRKLTVTSQDSQYHSIHTNITIELEKVPSTPLQMKLSTTGYASVTDSDFTAYRANSTLDVGNNQDGSTKTVYLTLKTQSGKLIKKEVNYTLYKNCTETKFISSSTSSCSARCGSGVQTTTISYQDIYTASSCPSEIQTTACNAQDCCSQTIESGSWKDVTACSQVCGTTGVKTQEINLVSYYDNGVSCGTKKNTAVACNRFDCCNATRRVEGAWGDCSKSCGEGTQTRSVQLYSQHNNQYCSALTEKRSCKLKDCTNVTIKNKDYHICPEDQNRPTEAQCNSSKESYNGLFVSNVRKQNGTEVCFHYRLHMNVSSVTWDGNCTGRALCVARASNNSCSQIIKRFNVGSANWLSLGDNISGDTCIDVDGWTSGNYKLIVKSTGGCDSKKFCFMDLNNVVMFNISG